MSSPKDSKGQKPMAKDDKSSAKQVSPPKEVKIAPPSPTQKQASPSSPTKTQATQNSRPASPSPAQKQASPNPATAKQATQNSPPSPKQGNPNEAKANSPPPKQASPTLPTATKQANQSAAAPPKQGNPNSPTSKTPQKANANSPPNGGSFSPRTAKENAPSTPRNVNQPESPKQYTPKSAKEVDDSKQGKLDERSKQAQANARLYTPRKTLSRADATPGGRALGEPGKDLSYGRGAALGALHKESMKTYQQEFQKWLPLKPGEKDINQQVLENWRSRKLEPPVEHVDATPGGRELGEGGKDLSYGRGISLGALHGEPRKQYQTGFQKFSPKPRGEADEVNQQVLSHWKSRNEESSMATGFDFACAPSPQIPLKERVPPRRVRPSDIKHKGEMVRAKSAADFVLHERGGMPPPIATAEELKAVLTRRYGNIVRGWRLGIDQNGDGSLNLSEFCNACRQIGLRGQFRSIFRSLDEDGSQTISLQEFDKEAFDTINAFKDLLSNKYVTIENSWAALAKDSPGGITAHQFYDGCERIGFKGDAKKLLKYMDMETFGAGRVTMDELEFLHLPSNADFEPRKKYVKPQIQLERGKRHPILCLDDLKRELIKKFGNIVTAWRVGIDADGDGKLTIAEFGRACRNLGFEGNMRTIFRELDNDGSCTVSLKEFDPHAAQVFNDFREVLLEKYGTLHKAWNHGLARDSPGGLHKDKFLAAVERVGYKGDAAELLSYLDTDTFGNGRVTMDELEFLQLPDEDDHVAPHIYF